MCGITGQFSLNQQRIDRVNFNQMRDSLVHRGPDGYGSEFFRNDTVALGHRRLAIIDLSAAGRQPMSNENNTIWVTFNGEIYNHKTIRRTLVKEGHVFRSNTDTEILIHGYEQWGIEGLLERIKGMFAFCIWDDQSATAYLARDRFGIKPLYLYSDSKTVIFSSEAKAITTSTCMQKKVDIEAIADFFNYAYIPSPKSIWHDVQKVMPSHYLRIEPNKSFIGKQTRYWHLETSDDAVSFDEASNATGELIATSVREHLESDVPVGLFLSGGYDSSYLLQEMNKMVKQTDCFTIGFQDSTRSEEKVAEETARAFNATHHKEMIKGDFDFLDIIQEMSLYYDEPHAVSSSIPYYLTSRLASKQVKVAFAGDGGDEAFAGYTWHDYAENYFSKRSLKSRLYSYLIGENRFISLKYDRWMLGVHAELGACEFLNSDILKAAKTRGLYFFENSLRNGIESVKQWQLLDIESFMPEACLVRADRSSMAHSLELRVPFVDHKIFEYMMTLSPRVYHQPGVKKPLIARNLKDKVPDSVLKMPKSGFSFQTLDKFVETAFHELVLGGELEKHGIITGQPQRNISPRLMYLLISLEQWWRDHYVIRNRPAVDVRHNQNPT